MKITEIEKPKEITLEDFFQKTFQLEIDGKTALMLLAVLGRVGGPYENTLRTETLYNSLEKFFQKEYPQFEHYRSKKDEGRIYLDRLN